VQGRPNVVFLLPDQLRADFLSCYGATFIETPNIDSLAAHGVRYANAFSASPLCVPARTALLTGMNALRNGVLDNLRSLRPDYREAGIRTWPELLIEGGYQTSAIGKMHFYPWDDERGFQHRVVAEDKRWLLIQDDYEEFLSSRGLRKLHGKEHEGYEANKGAVVSRIPWEDSPDRFVGQKACDFIREQGDRPFALMVGFPGPHDPYDPDPRFLARIDAAKLPKALPEVLKDTGNLRARNVSGYRRPWADLDYADFPEDTKARIRAHYAALVLQIDHEVGQILGALRETGKLENTVVILSSDHGDYLGDHNLIGKASFFESAIRVPLVVRLPGVADAAVCEELVELRDVTPTMLEFAGCAVPAYMDARSLPGAGMPGNRGRGSIVGFLADGWMIFDGRYKLHKYDTGDVLMYDIGSDPGEQHNLARVPSFAGVVERLDAALTREVMQSVQAAMHDRLASADGLVYSASFGKRRWRRPWPHAVLPADACATDARVEDDVTKDA